MVALVGELGVLNLDGAVDHVLLKQPASTVANANELEVGIADCVPPLSTSVSDAIGEQFPLRHLLPRATLGSASTCRRLVMSLVAVKVVVWHATMGIPVRVRAEGSMNTTAWVRAEVNVAVPAQNTSRVEYGVRQRLIRRVSG